MGFSKNEKGLIGILAAVQFVHIVDFMIVMPLGPILMQLFQISTAQFGYIVSAYTVSAGLSGFVASFYVDRFDRKRMLAYLFLGFLLGTLGCALAPSYFSLLGARALTGLFGGILSSLVFSMVSDAIEYERRGAAMGLIMSAFSLASILGVPVSLWLAVQFHWHTPFYALAAASVFIFFGILKMVPSFRSHLTGPRVSPLEIIQDLMVSDRQQRALLFMAMMTLGHFLIIPFISPSMVMNVGLTQEQLPLIYLVGGLASMLTGPWIGRLADRMGKHLVFSFSGSFIVLPILLMTQLGQTPLYQVLFLVAVFFALTGGRMIPATAMVSEAVPPHRRGGFMSLVSSMQNLAAGLASLIAGQIVVQNHPGGTLLHYDSVGYLSVFFSLVTLYLGQKIVRYRVK